MQNIFCIFVIMSAKIDTYIVALIFKGVINMYIQYFGLSDYLCIEIPKNSVAYYDNNLYIFKTIFTVEKKISDDMYIVSKAQYEKAVNEERMITIKSLLSLDNFLRSNYRIFVDVKNKDTFMVKLKQSLKFSLYNYILIFYLLHNYDF